MAQAISILFGAALTVAVCLAAGTLLLRSTGAGLFRQEERVLAFVVGAACLSLLTFLLCTVGAARKGVFLILGLAILALAFKRGAHRPIGEPLPPIPIFWRWFFAAIFVLFSVLYFFNAMAPETSPDGVTYHLGLVSRYARAHGFVRITNNMYANLSQGVEMLFLFAFAFGRHSAASLTHFAFLLALPLAMLCYARRCGFPIAGVCGALLVFVSPVVGIDGTVAYNDVATACIIFTAFYLVHLWAADPSNRGLLAPLGLVAGFGYAAKYTAFLVVPYTLAIVVWTTFRRREPLLRPILIVTGCAALMIAPWMIKDAVWVGNPVSPFLNSVFPNPYIHISFEKEYSEMLRHYDGLKANSDIPFEVTMRGAVLGGLLGPIFLLAPLALKSLRSPAGRRLLFAALLFGLPYMANIGTRFLIPALPFAALGMGLVFARREFATAVLLLAHAFFSWPSQMTHYCSPNAWRLLPKIPIRQALRIEPEDSYLAFRLPNYGAARMIEKKVPDGQKVLAFSGVPEAYTTREILVGYQSAFGENIRDMLWTAMFDGMQPRWRQRFRYPAEPLRQVRVVQTAGGVPGDWTVSEFRIFHGAAELPRAADWKLRARPNPWDVQLAFDNSPVTRWRACQPLYPGMYLGVEFGAPQISDSALVECVYDQGKTQLKLEGMDAAGKWKTLAAKPELSDVPPISRLRQAAADELKARGVSYLLVYDSDYGAADFRDNARRWGIKLLGEYNGARLYRFD